MSAQYNAHNSTHARDTAGGLRQRMIDAGTLRPVAAPSSSVSSVQKKADPIPKAWRDRKSLLEKEINSLYEEHGGSIPRDLWTEVKGKVDDSIDFALKELERNDSSVHREFLSRLALQFLGCVMWRYQEVSGAVKQAYEGHEIPEAVQKRLDFLCLKNSEHQDRVHRQKEERAAKASASAPDERPKLRPGKTARDKASATRGKNPTGRGAVSGPCGIKQGGKNKKK